VNIHIDSVLEQLHLEDKTFTQAHLQAMNMVVAYTNSMSNVLKEKRDEIKERLQTDWLEFHDGPAVFDTIGGETYRRSFKVLKKGSIIVSMLEQPNSELMNQYGVKAIFQFTQVNRDRLTELAQWVDQNNIRVNVEKTFQLDEAGNALDYQKDIHPRGKVVLTVEG